MKDTRILLGYFRDTVSLGYRDTAPYIYKGRSILTGCETNRTQVFNLAQHITLARNVQPRRATVRPTARTRITQKKHMEVASLLCVVMAGQPRGKTTGIAPPM